MYKQTDWISMGSPLGPILSDIFYGFNKKQLIKNNFPIYYKLNIESIFPDDKYRDSFL